MISVGSGGVEGTAGEVRSRKERRKLRSMTWDACRREGGGGKG